MELGNRPQHVLLKTLRGKIAGEIYTDSVQRQLYSTDASIYQELPLAVAVPKTEADIRELILFANEHRLGLIPRTAGTSLAGQVVGSGIVVDVSRHFTRILEINPLESWVRVQPGVIRNELNLELAKHDLFFAPETSTANRAMIGGMLGNNSCGANSIVFGTTRDHVLEVRGFLSDGSLATFGPISNSDFDRLCERNDNQLVSAIYRQLKSILSPLENRNEIRKQFPKPTIHRRNTGYAIDALLECQPFDGNRPLNLSQLIAGSEGTLFFATEVKLNCVARPAGDLNLVCAHFHDLRQAFQATQIAMTFQPSRCEIIDRLVIEGARRNIAQSKNLQFVSGSPAAILMIEFLRPSYDESIEASRQLIERLRALSLGYDFPLLDSQAAENAWAVRRAGLGVVNNQLGDIKPVTVIEDTAVDLADLPEFIDEIDRVLANDFGLSCVHYGHAGAGEIHLRPNLNLKDRADRIKLRRVAEAVQAIVKKYQGSLSGEHGDGRLRGEFLESFIGPTCYQWLKQIKSTWDPHNVFNPGKIIDAPAMDLSLRLQHKPIDQPKTVFGFKAAGSLLAAVEMCSGSGDCRKTQLSGGTMCPSYMATRNEQDTTRARANILRQMLIQPLSGSDPVTSEQVKGVMDLCLSCKGCRSECPSNVDMARIKAEFMHGYYAERGVPFRIKVLANFEKMCRFASWAPWLFNLAGSQQAPTASMIKKMLGIHRQRELPRLHRQTLRSWFSKRTSETSSNPKGTVILFCDEFTNYLDVSIGIAAIELLERLGYRVTIPPHCESGRTSFSSGLLPHAKKIAEANVRSLAGLVSSSVVMIGIEPSAILTFRDEYPDIVDSGLQADARKLASHTFLIDEFLAGEIDAGRIDSSMFKTCSSQILLHGHCHQKALSNLDCTAQILRLPGFRVSVIPSGCCGMAGFFGYDKQHYELSMQIGELVLFPAIRQGLSDVMIAATGTSCRQQIHDGTGRNALHPVQILRDCLISA